MNTSNIFSKLLLIPNPANQRVFGLDLMRAFAIIFVVIGHGNMLQHVDTAFPWIKFINGVELFFVLSGFLIGGILIKTFQNAETFSLKLVWQFWIRRWFRTLPNYYLILLINILIVYLGLTGANYDYFNWKFFFFLQNFSSHFVNFFWESWSLTIEEWFYLLFPILLFVIYYILSAFKIARKLIFLIAIAVFFLVPFLFRFHIAAEMQVDSFWLYVKIYKVVIFRIDSIAWGLLAAVIKFYYPKLWYSSRNWTFIVGIIVSYAILYSNFGEPNDFFTKVYKIYFTSIGCFLLLPKFDSIKTAPRVISNVVTHISIISYSMYLINLSIISDLLTKNIPPKTDEQAWFLYGIYWILVLLFSTLLYKYFEKPMLDLRDKIGQKKGD